jgi:hypothetical protein
MRRISAYKMTGRQGQERMRTGPTAQHPTERTIGETQWATRTSNSGWLPWTMSASTLASTVSFRADATTPRCATNNNECMSSIADSRFWNHGSKQSSSGGPPAWARRTKSITTTSVSATAPLRRTPTNEGVGCLKRLKEGAAYQQPQKNGTGGQTMSNQGYHETKFPSGNTSQGKVQRYFRSAKNRWG